MKIGFTGNQDGMNVRQRKEFANLMLWRWSVTGREDEFHHGDCVGSDEQAHIIVRQIDHAWIAIHPPENTSKQAGMLGNESFPPKRYETRNHEIVDACDVLIATPSTEDEVLRSGTWATIRYAKRQHKPVIIIGPYTTTEFK